MIHLYHLSIKYYLSIYISIYLYPVALTKGGGKGAGGVTPPNFGKGGHA